MPSQSRSITEALFLEEGSRAKVAMSNSKAHPYRTTYSTLERLRESARNNDPQATVKSACDDNPLATDSLRRGLWWWMQNRGAH
jgi:hypothetical protein